MKEYIKYYWKKFTMFMALTPWFGDFLGIIFTLFYHWCY